MKKSEIKNKIRRGILPKYSLARDEKDDKQPETYLTFKGPKRFHMVDGKPEFMPRKKRTWRLVATEVLLADEEEAAALPFATPAEETENEKV